jgi:hypothetical protein
VQHLGKVLVLWRPNPELNNCAAPGEGRIKPAQSGSQAARPRDGPRAPVDPVREPSRRNPDACMRQDARRALPRRQTNQGSAKSVRPVPAAARVVPQERRARKFARGAAPFGDDSGPRFEAPSERRKSTYTPKTKPKSFSAKPNPREAWAKKPSAGGAKTATPRRRRKA